MTFLIPPNENVPLQCTKPGNNRLPEHTGLHARRPDPVSHCKATKYLPHREKNGVKSPYNKKRKHIIALNIN
jgi:hypothetical protein